MFAPLAFFRVLHHGLGRFSGVSVHKLFTRPGASPSAIGEQGQLLDASLRVTLQSDMPAAPWRSFRKAEPGQDYLALLSFLPLKSFWHIPAFLVGAVGVMRQLAAAEGLIAYSLLARPMVKHFWTLSVWQDDAALGAFIRHPPHVRLMISLTPRMGQTKFVRWIVKGSALPLLWDDALRHM